MQIDPQRLELAVALGDRLLEALDLLGPRAQLGEVGLGSLGTRCLRAQPLVQIAHAVRIGLRGGKLGLELVELLVRDDQQLIELAGALGPLRGLRELGARRLELLEHGIELLGLGLRQLELVLQLGEARLGGLEPFIGLRLLELDDLALGLGERLSRLFELARRLLAALGDVAQAVCLVGQRAQLLGLLVEPLDLVAGLAQRGLQLFHVLVDAGIGTPRARRRRGPRLELADLLLQLINVGRGVGLLLQLVDALLQLFLARPDLWLGSAAQLGFELADASLELGLASRRRGNRRSICRLDGLGEPRLELVDLRSELDLSQLEHLAVDGRLETSAQLQQLDLLDRSLAVELVEALLILLGGLARRGALAGLLVLLGLLLEAHELGLQTLDLDRLVVHERGILEHGLSDLARAPLAREVRLEAPELALVLAHGGAQVDQAFRIGACLVGVDPGVFLTLLERPLALFEHLLAILELGAHRRENALPLLFDALFENVGIGLRHRSAQAAGRARLGDLVEAARKVLGVAVVGDGSVPLHAYYRHVCVTLEGCYAAVGEAHQRTSSATLIAMRPVNGGRMMRWRSTTLRGLPL